MPYQFFSVNAFLLIYLILYLSLSVLSGFLIPSSIAGILVTLLPVLLGIGYLKMTHQSIQTAIRFKKFHPLTILLIIPFTLALRPLFAFISSISMLYSTNIATDVIGQKLQTQGILLPLLTTAVSPALIEEFTFRGVVYGQYRRIHPVKAIFLSALSFGLMHMNFNQFTYTFVIGIVFVLVIEATGSIIPAMIMHFIFNASSLLSYFISMSQKSAVLSTAKSLTLTELRSLLPFFMISITLGCACAFFLFYKIAKLNGTWDTIKSWFHPSELPTSDQKATDIFFYIFVMICLLFCVITEFIH